MVEIAGKVFWGHSVALMEWTPNLCRRRANGGFPYPRNARKGCHKSISSGPRDEREGGHAEVRQC
jgi:hypothetical protein